MNKKHTVNEHGALIAVVDGVKIPVAPAICPFNDSIGFFCNIYCPLMKVEEDRLTLHCGGLTVVIETEEPGELL